MLMRSSGYGTAEPKERMEGREAKDFQGACLGIGVPGASFLLSTPAPRRDWSGSLVDRAKRICPGSGVNDAAFLLHACFQGR